MDSEGLGMSVLIWMLHTWVYSICDTSLSCTFVKHIFLYVYLIKYACLRKTKIRGFPGGAVVKTLPFSAGGVGSIPGQGTKIPRASGCSQKIEK